MKIALGIDGRDSPEAVRGYIDDGVDSFFASYVPAQWSNTYGWEVSPNRRPFGAEFHFTSLSDLRAVINAAHEKGAHVCITLNAHKYSEPQLPLLHALIRDLESVEPDAYIVASPALLIQLREWGVVERSIHLSTGAGCYNSDAIRYFMELTDNIKRVVIPRKMSLGEMRGLINAMADTDIEFEVMVLGYRCHFNDEYCFTRHSSTDANFCQLFADAETATLPHYPDDWKQILTEIVQDPAHQMQEGSALDRFSKNHLSQERKGRRLLGCALRENTKPGMSATLTADIHQNCGLCMIPALREIGVNVLKLPSRGDEPWLKRRHLHLVRTMLDTPDADEHTAQQLVNSPAFCEHLSSCYYNHPPQ